MFRKTGTSFDVTSFRKLSLHFLVVVNVQNGLSLFSDGIKTSYNHNMCTFFTTVLNSTALVSFKI